MFTLKRGDTSPSLRAILRDGTGAAMVLTGATIVFSMATQKGVSKISRRAVARDDAVDVGAVLMNWITADTDTVGVFNAEFEVMFQNGKVETVPNDGYLIVKLG